MILMKMMKTGEVEQGVYIGVAEKAVAAQVGSDSSRKYIQLKLPCTVHRRKIKRIGETDLRVA